MSKKVKIRWTIQVTEDYEEELDFEDFASLFGDPPPTLEEVMSGEVDKGDIDAEQMAGSEEEDNRLYVSVDERYIDSFEIIG